MELFDLARSSGSLCLGWRLGRAAIVGPGAVGCTKGLDQRKGIHFLLSLAMFNAEVEAELHGTRGSVFLFFAGCLRDPGGLGALLIGLFLATQRKLILDVPVPSVNLKLSRRCCGAKAKKITRSISEFTRVS